MYASIQDRQAVLIGDLGRAQSDLQEDCRIEERNPAYNYPLPLNSPSPLYSTLCVRFATGNFDKEWGLGIILLFGLYLKWLRARSNMLPKLV